MNNHSRLYPLFLEDFTLAGLALLMAIYLFTSAISHQNGKWAMVYVDNQLSQKINLTIPKLYHQGKMVLQVDSGQIRVKASTCPEQICVHTGWISKKGQILVCAPNHVLIEINNER